MKYKAALVKEEPLAPPAKHRRDAAGSLARTLRLDHVRHVRSDHRGAGAFQPGPVGASDGMCCADPRRAEARNLALPGGPQAEPGLEPIRRDGRSARRIATPRHNSWGGIGL